MLVDFFTIPLGGSLFVTMRDICQGSMPILELKVRHKHKQDTSENSTEINSIIHKERVGNNETRDTNTLNLQHIKTVKNVRSERTNDTTNEKYPKDTKDLLTP